MLSPSYPLQLQARPCTPGLRNPADVLSLVPAVYRALRPKMDINPSQLLQNSHRMFTARFSTPSNTNVAPHLTRLHRDVLGFSSSARRLCWHSPPDTATSRETEVDQATRRMAMAVFYPASCPQQLRLIIMNLHLFLPYPRCIVPERSDRGWSKLFRNHHRSMM